MRDNRFDIIRTSAIVLLAIIYCLLFVLIARDVGPFRFPEGQGNALRNITFLYNGAFILLLYLLESFNIGRRRLLDLFFGFGLSSVIVNVMFYLVFITFVPFLHRQTLRFCLILAAEQLVVGWTWVMCLHRIYEKFHFRKKAIFVYGNREDPYEVEQINRTINKYFKITRSMKFTNDTTVIRNAIRSAAVLYIGDIPAEARNRLIKYCMSVDVECYSVPKISDIYINSAKVAQLNDKLLLQYPQIGISGYRMVLKRLLDIVVSLNMLIILSPVMLLIAILVKAEDGGPVFFCQDRVTKDEANFKMLKFRSMRVSAEEEGPRLASVDDDRVTKVGKVIRKIHFDELPQLINILKGDMSLVGPRPERREFIEYYSAKSPEFAERLKVQGGLTGFAQVYGRYNTDSEDKIKYDLYYIYNYSLRLDIKLLLLTLRILFQKENTQGFNEEQAKILGISNTQPDGNE